MSKLSYRQPSQLVKPITGSEIEARQMALAAQLRDAWIALETARVRRHWRAFLGVDGLDSKLPRPHWKRPGLGLRSE
jgi:hypothetical protein